MRWFWIMILAIPFCGCLPDNVDNWEWYGDALDPDSDEDQSYSYLCDEIDEKYKDKI